ncbi:up-regulator of cell proliferation-like [Discoglossus pictus]
MKQYKSSKLTLKDVLDIGQETIQEADPQNVEDIPWHFIRKLMGLKMTARNTQCVGTSADNPDDVLEESDDNEDATSPSFHPLDVMCVILHCADMFLQQEILSKMSMCQFAVPLLLPAGDGPDCTFMIWAMRDIMKRWRPQSLAQSKGFREESLVNIKMPTFSFVRLGKSKLSKSKILNTVLSPTNQYHDFFIHENMECGNVQRKISDGLVEISWYFPAGKASSDTFPESIAVTNLRGDLESNWTQFSFLSQVSSVVFIFVESLSEREVQLLSNCSNSETKYCFIISPSNGKRVSNETLGFLKQLVPLLKIDPRYILRKDRIANDAELKNKIHGIINNVLNDRPKTINLEHMSEMAYNLGIHVDESSEKLQEAKTCAIEITNEIKDVVRYKEETLKLQGDLWRQLSQTEKEMCRMRKQGDKPGEEYKDELRQRLSELHRKQYQQDLPSGMMKFISAVTHLSHMEKHYFLKIIKLELDKIARESLTALKSEYTIQCMDRLNNHEALKQLDKIITDSSLGVEHFLRELGQFYEAEYVMVTQTHIKQFTKLPGIAADLLLDGFPLELIDGDASNIPLQWITDVLTELDKKTGGGCRMRVITVLGVQSTGKSTLLNTMFGLQFPVSSGRCTRGAFMTLIKVKENFQEELGCDFILVIDTEGLKAPELASLDHSYEHDNELATLVIGLSDITIINMAMENTAEMKDILQIVVHAFLRMKEIGKKPNCQFVHQNVSDVSAHVNNMRDRKKLLEQLDEMTKIAATMEKKSGIKSFSDVMDYDFEKHNWYIPGLWQGVPPMAPINGGYSENISEVKKYLLDFFRSLRVSNKSQNIREFNEWIKSLWKAVKHEKFIFSFRNSLVAEAYNHLSIKSSQWEWIFNKQVHSWLIKAETNIKNQTANKLDKVMCMLKEDLYGVLVKEEKTIKDLLEKYFESGTENVNLIERYREDFFRSVSSLKKELEKNTLTKINEAVRIRKGKYEIQRIQDKSQRLIEKKVTDLLGKCRMQNCELNEEEITNEFENMWQKTLSELQTGDLERRNVKQVMLGQLRNDMGNKGGAINEALLKVGTLEECGQTDFKVDKNSVETSWRSLGHNKIYISQDCYNKIQKFADSLIDQCKAYVTQKVNTKEDYDEMYSLELLQMINTSLQEENVKTLHITSLFQMQIKLFIFRRAAPMFQKMHNNFIQENDPKICLEKLKPKYFVIFQNIFHEKDGCRQRAKSFCKDCLKPAMTDYIYRHLGKEIVDDVQCSGSVTFSSRTFFQFSLLEELLKGRQFNEYVEYILTYEKFVKRWIAKYISDKYKESGELESLQSNILSSITKQVKETLKNKAVLESFNLSEFLENFCEFLKNELVISQDEMKLILFHNMADIKTFSNDTASFLTETEKQILAEMRSLDIKTVLSKVMLKPEDELFKKMIGCGKQCPFCKVPCEAGARDHTEHFASVHRPQGLGTYHKTSTKVLVVEICSTAVAGDGSFHCAETNDKYHPYKEYRKFYPDWAIQPDPSIDSSDYWKFIFTHFNEQFAKEYDVNPAKIPEGWKNITEGDALRSLKETYNMK